MITLTNKLATSKESDIKWQTPTALSISSRSLTTTSLLGIACRPAHSRRAAYDLKSGFSPRPSTWLMSFRIASRFPCTPSTGFTSAVKTSLREIKDAADPKPYYRFAAEDRHLCPDKLPH